jgi:polysaccharide pyruvyl transferase WcaK-like protein
LLDFVKSGNKRISYSASFGAITFQGDEIDKQHFDYNIKKFDAISIREDEGCELLKREFGLNSIRLIDGAFHISKEKLEEITKEYKTEEKYIAIFVFPIYKKEAWYKELVQKIQEKLNISIKEYNGKTVEEWLSYIKNAQFVIAGSYHAIVFSIIFNVPFVQIKSDLHAQSRFATLFRMLNIKDNTISRYDKNYNWNDLYVERNWKEINSLIEKEKNIAKKWMENALKKEVVNNKESDISNLIRYEIEIAKNEKPLKKTGFIRLKYNLIKILIALSFGKTKNKLKQEKEKLVHLFKKGIM